MKKQSIHKSLIVLLSFWLGVGCVPLVAKADPISDILKSLTDIDGDIKAEFPDASKNLNTINDLNKDIKGLSDSIKTATEGQLTEVQNEWTALTKSYEMSRVLSNAVPLELWSADDLNSALSSASGGNSARFDELKAAYAEQNPTLTSTATNQSVNVSDLVKKTYDQKSAVTNTALATSQQTYNDVNYRIKNFDDLKAMIDTDTPNEKASMDLMSRILVEIGYLQTEMLRQQSMNAQLTATNAQEEINGQTSSKNFFSQSTP